MKKSQSMRREYLTLAEHSLREHHLPRIERCLKLLTEDEIWWRPNESSNSAGNLALHLAGNVRQWIVSGLGGAPDHRVRDEEFAARGPVPRAKLIRGLRAAVSDACEIFKRLTDDDLGKALERFGDAAVLPVVRDGRLVGLLDRDGVVNYIRMRDLFAQGQQGR